MTKRKEKTISILLSIVKTVTESIILYSQYCCIFFYLPVAIYFPANHKMFFFSFISLKFEKVLRLVMKCP